MKNYLAHIGYHKEFHGKSDYKQNYKNYNAYIGE